MAVFAVLNDRSMIPEREFIAALRTRCSSTTPTLLKGIGDDCAVYRLGNDGGRKLGLISMDTLVEGTHFDLGWHPPRLLGRKAVSVNISDIAAMGGAPTFLLLSLSVPTTCSADFLEEFIQGFTEQAHLYGACLIGGDTVRSGGGISLSVTVLGEVDEDRILYRSGARVGDLIWVSGSLGDAAAGLLICSALESDALSRWPTLVQAHLDPQPEVLVGQALARSSLVTALIDMSDGLATDLAHVCLESGCGAIIDASAIPLSEALLAAAPDLEISAMELALQGGEDYRLLFTSPPAARETLQGLVLSSCGQEIHCIGTIVTEPGVRIQTEGAVHQIDFTGFDHFGGGYDRA